jgi:GTP-binding protein EngB required for normal cell division/Tfp pilus assembly protein PilF
MGLFDRIAGTLDGLARDESDRDAEELDAAMALAGQGDLAAAELQLRDITERRPRLARAFARLGEVLVRRGADEEAATAYGRAVDLDSENIDAWFELGELLARLRRFEPARDALRRALTLSFDPAERARAYAALGRLFADHGALGKAVRELGKAVHLSPGDHALAAAYGRVLVRAGDPGAAAWLTSAALAPGADPHLIIDAAAATEAPADAERLLREALARTPGEVAVRAALSRHLTRIGRQNRAQNPAPRTNDVATDGAAPEAAPHRALAEGRALALEAVAAAPDDGAAMTALRESFAAEGRWREALEAAHREGELGAPLSFEERLALGLGARDRATLAALSAELSASDTSIAAAAIAPALAGFLNSRAEEADLIALAAFAPDEASQRFVVEGLAPAPVPTGNLFALLGYAHDLAVRTPELRALVLPAARATEAFDRPLLVAVMGEFNAGKSSFVNALCGEEIAPVGVTPTTATINILRHGAMGGRAIYHDGRARELDAMSVAPFLRGLGGDEAAAIRTVEIFYPLEILRRVEVVDTPGLNSLRPEHESVARDFLVEADAIVWLFAVGQAAKSTEKQALRLAHAAGKRVLGVLNKIDRASPDEVAEVSKHVVASMGDLIEAVVPISARRGLAAKAAKAAPGADDGGLAALEEALEQRFFQHARALKRTTALGALRRFVAEAGRATATPIDGGAPPGEAVRDFPAMQRLLAAQEERVRGTIAAERVALRARIDEAYRSAAFEVREFVRPRSWLFGEHRAEAADEEFLIDLLDEAIGRATTQTRRALTAALSPGAGAEGTSLPSPALDGAFILAFERACARAVDRFRAYARGVLEGGAVADFVRQDLPRIRLDLAAIRNALARRAPDPEEALFRALDREVAQVFRDTRRDLDHAETATGIRALLRRERVERPLDQLARAIAALEH